MRNEQAQVDGCYPRQTDASAIKQTSYLSRKKPKVDITKASWDQEPQHVVKLESWKQKWIQAPCSSKALKCATICNKFGPKSEPYIKETRVRYVKRTESTSNEEVKS